MRCLALTLIAALGSTAIAEDKTPTTFEGDEAKGLVRALSLTTLKPSTKEKSKKIWTVKMLGCTTKDTKEIFELPVTTCDADGKKITGAAAVLVEAAMNAAKIPAPYMMGQKQIRAASLTCTLNERPKESGPFVCTYTPVGRG